MPIERDFDHNSQPRIKTKAAVYEQSSLLTNFLVMRNDHHCQMSLPKSEAFVIIPGETESVAVLFIADSSSFEVSSSILVTTSFVVDDITHVDIPLTGKWVCVRQVV